MDTLALVALCQDFDNAPDFGCVEGRVTACLLLSATGQDGPCGQQLPSKGDAFDDDLSPVGGRLPLIDARGVGNV